MKRLNCARHTGLDTTVGAKVRRTYLKRAFAFLICALIVFQAPPAAHADVGPKPSVVIDFEGLGGVRCYVTLLSSAPSTGPYSVYDESRNSGYSSSDGRYGIWEKFVSFEDEDGFFFLQFFSDCSDSARFTWGYYPPAEFKILLYLPDSDCFLVSEEIYERYAFDSYFTVKVSGDILNVAKELSSIPDTAVQKTYEYGWEIASLIIRIIVTVVLEVLVALLFGYRHKKQLLFILLANIVTQSGLNVLLNLMNYKYGGLAFIFGYVLLEIIATAVEAILYSRRLDKYRPEKPRRKWVAPVYAIVANVASFGVGFFLSFAIPGIF